MRDTLHAIDLVLSEAHPNKAGYRMAPKEKEEQEKQVQKLLDKGYISPCVVHALLTLKKLFVAYEHLIIEPSTRSLSNIVF